MVALDSYFFKTELVFFAEWHLHMFQVLCWSSLSIQGKQYWQKIWDPCDACFVMSIRFYFLLLSQKVDTSFWLLCFTYLFYIYMTLPTGRPVGGPVGYIYERQARLWVIFGPCFFYILLLMLAVNEREMAGRAPVNTQRVGEAVA